MFDRQKQKPKYELTCESKKIWEKLRIQKNQLSKEQNHKLVDELLLLVKSKDKNVSVSQHPIKIILINKKIFFVSPTNFSSLSNKF